MKTTKQFTKSNSVHYNKTMELSRKEQQVQQQASLKYQKFKKSASLPSYYLNQARLKKITEIYRTLSSDKINLHSSKSRRNSPSHTPQKNSNLHVAIFKPININSLDLNSKQKAKLTIQRGSENTAKAPQSGNTSWAQLTIKLRTMANHFEDMYNIKSQETFINQMEKYFQNFKKKYDGKNRGYTGEEELNNCIKIFGDCLMRREQINISNVRKEFAQISEEVSNLQIELKKKTIRTLLDQKQIEKVQKQKNQLEQQLIELKKSLQKQVKHIACGVSPKENEFARSNDYNKTQNIFANTQILTLTAESAPYIRSNCNCNQELERKNIQLAECLHKMHGYAKRNKEFLSVLVVLQRQGIDIEKIYDDVINGRVSSAEEEQTKMTDSANKLRRNERKIYSKYRSMKATNEFDADESIISSADGLSFNYDQKSLQEDVYTIRREYKCKKEMQAGLKDKLKLNFDVLYDEQLYEDDYQSQIEQQVDNPPTI